MFYRRLNIFQLPNFSVRILTGSLKNRTYFLFVKFAEAKINYFVYQNQFSFMSRCLQRRTKKTKKKIHIFTDFMHRK